MAVVLLQRCFDQLTFHLLQAQAQLVGQLAGLPKSYPALAAQAAVLAVARAQPAQHQLAAPGLEVELDVLDQHPGQSVFVATLGQTEAAVEPGGSEGTGQSQVRTQHAGQGLIVEHQQFAQAGQVYAAA